MVYYNNKKFAYEAKNIGQEYKKKLSAADSRKKRINLALQYYDRFLKASSQNNIELECHKEPLKEFIRYTASLINKNSCKTILDYGCAEGNLLNKLWEKNKDLQYYGIDFDIYNGKKNKFIYLQYDKNYLIPENKYFDLILTHHVVEHIHPQDVMAHMHDVYEHLNPGGIYFINLPSKYCANFWDTSVIDNFHIGQYEYNELSEKLKKAGFTKIKMVLFNIGYCPPGINILVNPNITKYIVKAKNKYIYALFNLLTMRLVAYK